MGMYTVLEDPNADKAVQEVLDLVVKHVLKTVGEKRVKAIVLVGGFGRGEGGVYQEGNHYKLVNDLDIKVFLNGYAGVRALRGVDASLERLGEELLPECPGLKQIDICVAWPLALRLAPNLVSHYEVKWGHKVVYGAVDLKRMMPKLESKNLSIFDGTIYFFNRGSGLLISALSYFKGCLHERKFQENFELEIQKACLAMGDAYLLHAHKYDVSYRTRLENFQELVKLDEHGIPLGLLRKVSDLYCAAVEKKLQPAFSWRGADLMMGRWFEVRHVFSEFFLWYEGNRLRREFNDWVSYSDYVSTHGFGEPFSIGFRWSFGEMRRNILSRRREGHASIEKKTLMHVMPLLLGSLQSDLTGNTEMVHKASEIVRWGEKSDANTWQGLVEVFLRAYHYSGIVKEMLSYRQLQIQ
jgi:hypothetical protein